MEGNWGGICIGVCLIEILSFKFFFNVDYFLCRLQLRICVI